MNIGGNLSMAFISNDLGATALTSQTTGSSSPGLTGESPFKKLIAQALSNGELNQTGSAATGSAADDAAQETNSISSLLARLLIGNAGNAKLRMPTEGTNSSGSEVSELLQDDSESSDLQEESIASMLALFDGSFSAYLVKNSGNEDAGKAGTPLTAETVAEILGSNGSMISGSFGRMNQNGNSESLGNWSSQNDSVKLLSQIVDDGGNMTVTAEINGEQIVFAGIMKNSAAAEAAGMSGSGAVEASNMAESAEMTQNMTFSELTQLMKDKAQALNSQNIGNSGQAATQATQISGTENGSQNNAAIKTADESLQKEIPVSAEKQEGEAGSIEDSLRAMAYQNQLQSAGTSDTSAVNQMTPTVESAEVASQIRDQILTTLEQKGPTEFKMQLHPEDLGQIDISLKISEGKLIIDIIADKAQTQALLTGQVDKLISGMGLQNVQVESVQVSQQMDSERQNSQSQGYQMNSGMDFSQRRENSGETAESRQQILQGITGTQINFTAEEAANKILQARNNFGRMNYVI